MKIVLFAALATFLCAAEALGQVYDPPELNQPTPGTIAPAMLTCDTLEQLHSLIEANIRGGPYALNNRFNQINAARPEDKPACEELALDPTLVMHPVEHYALAVVLNHELFDLVVVEIDGKDGKKRFGMLERFVGLGYAT